LTDLQRIAGRVTIADLLRQALAKTGYPAVLTGLVGGTRLRRNVEKLVEIAEDSGKVLLGDFAAYLEDLTAKEVREGEATLEAAGAVRMMTVHASKGLEFPVVVLADAGWERRSGSSSPLVYDQEKRQLACKVYDAIESKYVPSFPYRRAERLESLREEAERKRLLYVAATRARDCLIISGEYRYSKQHGWGTSGWLRTILEPLDVGDVMGMGESYSYNYTEHGSVRVWLPTYEPESIKRLRSGGDAPRWRKLQVKELPESPALLRPITVQPTEMIGHISATQLADLGGYRHARSSDEKRYFRSSLRRAAFDDADLEIKDAVRVRQPRVKASQVGNVVHEALRYWRFPDTTENFQDVLRSYAWQQSITDEADLQTVVQRAQRLLERFQSSTIYKVMQDVRQQGLPFFTELPFIYRTEKRILHGVVDVLFQLPEGQWIVLDYKTSLVRGLDNRQQAILDHAQRYYLQVGAYASAVSRELGGIVPDVYIHYIQHNQTVEIPQAIWRAEIAQLEAVLGELMGSSDAETLAR
ncbi:MAG: PD-(D/E)XK nuclease family protein, partial [Anaerolineae bacterium]|nr:PD-(D/E)XK nuclease family protein [Anaerolineae bacterium]